MHALAFDRFGGPEVLTWREVPEPQVPPGHALVRIAAAGLNFADVYRRRGNYHLVGSAPWILGYEGAGTVVDGGGGEFPAGARVAFADSPHANAELVAVPIDRLIPIPDGISERTAAALLLQGLTAQYLCSDSFAVRAGQTAVVHAAAGGVGLLLCQLLAHAGARVIALASSEAKRDAAREAGAVHALGYDGDWADAVRGLAEGGADVVFDSVGTTLEGSMAAARTGGAVVFYGFAGGDPAPVDPRVLMDRSLTLTGGDLWNVLTTADERRRRAAELFALVAAGALTVRVAAEVPMPDGAEAHRLLEGRGTIGKIVLTR